MGASPAQQQADMMKGMLEDSIALGEKTVKDLRQQGKRYTTKAEKQQDEILNYLGSGYTPREYNANIRAEFPGFMLAEAQDWQGQLNQGNYPVLGSAAHQRAEDTLMRSVNAYRQQLGAGLDEIQPRFAAIHRDPAFNVQLDPEAQKWAQGNINLAQVKQLTNYSV